ncbi:MAG TPA: hypothetical protein PLO71_09080, partial [Thauera phenylacetica]|nr:hypothetical protein [Thauera phenylacetica]
MSDPAVFAPEGALTMQSAPALLAVDRDDLVLGATRAARQVLGLDDRRIATGVAASDLLQEDRAEDGRDLDDA